MGDPHFVPTHIFLCGDLNTRTFILMYWGTASRKNINYKTQHVVYLTNFVNLTFGFAKSVNFCYRVLHYAFAFALFDVLPLRGHVTKCSQKDLQWQYILFLYNIYIYIYRWGAGSVDEGLENAGVFQPLTCLHLTLPPACTLLYLTGGTSCSTLWALVPPWNELNTTW